MAWESQNTRLYWSSSTARSTTVDALIGEVTDFTGPGGAAAVIDVTHLLSTAKEKLPGLRDEGQLSMSLSFAATNTAQKAMINDRAARNRRCWQIHFSDTATSVCFGKGYVLQFSVSGAVDQKVSANAVIEIDGAVSWTTA